MADFDPCPTELHENAVDQMHSFLSKVKGKGLGVSLLLDKDCRYWCANDHETTPTELPSKDNLKQSIKFLKESLEIMPQKMSKILVIKVGSTLWHSVR